MGLKNDYTNELRKAQKANDESAAAYWQAQINALTKQRGDAAFARAESKRRKQNSYQVKRGDNWFTIADQIYGDQRMVGLLMEANVGIALLSQGQVLHLPPMPVLDAGGAVFFSQDGFDTALEIESDLKELTTPPDDSAALTAKYDKLFTPEDLAFAQEIADLMDEIDAEAFDPTAPK